MKAIISDIHSNLEALQAVLADIKSQGITRGLLPRRHRRLRPQSARVHRPGHGIASSSSSATTTRGRCSTRTASTRRPSEPSSGRARNSNRRPRRGRCARSAGSSSPSGRAATAKTASSSSTARARNPLNEYVFPEDIYNQRKMERIFALVERYCFQGHTHVPGIFTENMQFLSPEEVDYAYKLDGRKTLCNVGSRRPAARRRLAGVLRPARQRHDQVPPRRVRLADDPQEDLRHPRPRQLPRRPPRRRSIRASDKSRADCPE